jgi:hypothetical protein
MPVTESDVNHLFDAFREDSKNAPPTHSMCPHKVTYHHVFDGDFTPLGVEYGPR